MFVAIINLLHNVRVETVLRYSYLLFKLSVEKEKMVNIKNLSCYHKKLEHKPFNFFFTVTKSNTRKGITLKVKTKKRGKYENFALLQEVNQFEVNRYVTKKLKESSIKRKSRHLNSAEGKYKCKFCS